MPDRTHNRPHAGVVDPASLLEMAALVSRTSDTERALRIVSEYAMQTLACDGSAVFMYDAQERSITPLFVLTSGPTTPIVEDRIALRLSRDSAFWTSLHTDELVTYQGGRHLSPKPEVIDLSCVSLLALRSMSADGSPLGILLFHWNSGRQRLKPEEERLISALADQCAAVVLRGRLFRELEKSEEKYRLLTENARDMIFSLDMSGRFTFLNSAVHDILGYEPGELLDEYYSEIVTPESWQASQEAIRAASRAGEPTFSCEWVAKTRAGDYAYLDVRASFTHRGGEIIGQQGIARDVTEQRRLIRELSISLRRESEMKGYLALVTRVQEEERKRIARELHDDTVQAMVAMVRQLEILERQAGKEMPAVTKRILEMADLASTTLENLRRFTRDLRPPMLDDLGLEAALEWLIESAGARSGINVTFDVKGDQRKLEPEVEVAVYRIAQEGINNAINHASPQSITVTLAYEPESIRLTVADDGRGFLPPARFQPTSSGGLGLIGVHERARLLGGDVTIQSEPGSGTRLTLTIPCSMTSS